MNQTSNEHKKNNRISRLIQYIVAMAGQDDDPYKNMLENLAYWYFRLNGCLTIENFVVHPDWRRGQQTEIDLIAMRFPHRSDLLNKSMIDDQKIFSDPSRIHIF